MNKIINNTYFERENKIINKTLMNKIINNTLVTFFFLEEKDVFVKNQI